MKEKYLYLGGKIRNSNLELYRIIVMLLIVAHHYVVNSGLMEVMQEQPLSGDSIFLYIWGMWGKTGINCFVLITGYFMCKSTITWRKFLKLLLEIYFYRIVIYAVFLLSGYESFSFIDCMKVLIPVYWVDTNFVSCFLLFYLCIPFLNILVQNLSKRQHQLLIVLCLFIYTFIGSVPKFHVTMNYVSWFCVLYFISSYISRYNAFNSMSHARWGYLTLAAIVVSILSVIGLLWLPVFLHIPYIYPSRFVADSNVVLALVTAVCSFMYFKDLKMKHSPIVNAVGASTFGVLLIHAHSDTMRQWLWRDTLDNVGVFSSDFLEMHALVSVIGIFIVCIIIDYVRIHTLEKWAFKYVDKALLKYNLK